MSTASASTLARVAADGRCEFCGRLLSLENHTRFCDARCVRAQALKDFDEPREPRELSDRDAWMDETDSDFGSER